MKDRLLVLLSLALMGMVWPVAAGAVEPGEVVEAREVEEVVRKYFPEDAEGGLAVLVIRDGKVIHRKGYGLKNKKEPITPDTRMGLASISKQFAAMGAAFLIEEGKLNLSDKVSKHLPDVALPVEGRGLLVQDLLWHTSGLANFIQSKEKESIAKYKEKHGLKYLNNETHAEWLATQPLRRPPGREHEYTNSGYVLLARIVEVLGGKPFHEMQRERIFDVLGMEDTTDSKRFNGSGNMYMSLNDYEIWLRALREGTLLGEETSKLLYESGTLDNGERANYGFGWRLNYDGDELIEVHHGGAGSPPGSSRNYVLRDFRNGITVAFFARENLGFKRSVREKFAPDIRDALLK